MQIALDLGARHTGQTSPNPSVGCVIVQGEVIVGKAVTAIGGRPHAETLALEEAGTQAKGATAYVTLEPCCHHGQTAPCTNALIKAGISRVVIAAEDPNPEVSGKTIPMLRTQGITVEVGCCEQEAKYQLRGYFSLRKRNRPFVTIKLAMSIDGYLTQYPGERSTLSNPLSLRYAHHLRAHHDGILVGSETVIIDNPKLSCRLPGFSGRQPTRIAIDRRQRFTEFQALIHDASPSKPSLIISPSPYLQPKEGLEECCLDNLSLSSIMRELGKKGITLLLVEGGGTLASSLLNEGLADELIIITCPMIIGKGTTALRLPESINLNPIDHFTLGDNHVQRYRMST